MTKAQVPGRRTCGHLIQVGLADWEEMLTSLAQPQQRMHVVWGIWYVEDSIFELLNCLTCIHKRSHTG